MVFFLLMGEHRRMGGGHHDDDDERWSLRSAYENLYLELDKLRKFSVSLSLGPENLSSFFYTASPTSSTFLKHMPHHHYQWYQLNEKKKFVSNSCSHLTSLPLCLSHFFSPLPLCQWSWDLCLGHLCDDQFIINLCMFSYENKRILNRILWNWQKAFFSRPIRLYLTIYICIVWSTVKESRVTVKVVWSIDHTLIGIVCACVCMSFKAFRDRERNDIDNYFVLLRNLFYFEKLIILITHSNVCVWDFKESHVFVCECVCVLICLFFKARLLNVFNGTEARISIQNNFKKNLSLSLSAAA